MAVFKDAQEPPPGGRHSIAETQSRRGAAGRSTSRKDDTRAEVRAEAYFWATHAGAELDLLVVRGRQRLGFEIKRTDAPAMTPSMRSALQDLKLSRLYVIHAGRHSFDLTRNVRCIPATTLEHELQ